LTKPRNTKNPLASLKSLVNLDLSCLNIVNITACG
jgi:hypothetical protein